MSEFAKLLGELSAMDEEMRKSMDETDEKIAAAADEARGDDKPDGDDADAEEGEGQDEEGDEDGEPVLGKSFEFVDAAGKTVEAYDGTEIMKSLMTRFDALESDSVKDKEYLGKSMSLMAEILKSQASEIVMLKSKVEAMGSEGRGRKTILTVTEKQSTTMAKSEPAMPSGGEILAKCLSAQKTGKLTAHDVSRADIAVQSGLAVPADILARLPE